MARIAAPNIPLPKINAIARICGPVDAGAPRPGETTHPSYRWVQMAKIAIPSSHTIVVITET
jgi:hypothetical protein